MIRLCTLKQQQIFQQAIFLTIESIHSKNIDQINKEKIWTFCVLKLLNWHQKWVAFMWRLGLQLLPPGSKISFTTKYAVPGQIKPRILELNIRRSQSNFSVVFINFFVSCGHSHCMHQANSVFAGFSIHESEGINKTLNNWPFSKQWVLCPLDP